MSEATPIIVLPLLSFIDIFSMYLDFSLKFNIYLCICVCACLSIYAPDMFTCLWEQKIGISIPGVAVLDGCLCWELNLGFFGRAASVL